MEISKIFFVLNFLLFTLGCKENIHQNKTVEKDTVATINVSNDFLKEKKGVKGSFTISCGSGCAMTYTVKNISQELFVIRVKFNVDIYVNGAMVESYEEIYMFSYNNAGQVERVSIEGSEENVLESLMPDAQQSFREFANNLMTKGDANQNIVQSCIKKSRLSLPYSNKIDIKRVKYEKLLCDSIKGIDEFSCNQDKLRYISLPQKDDIHIILIPQDCGDFAYRFYLLTIKNNVIVDSLYVEGEWHEPDDEESKEITSFSLDDKYNITVKTKTLSSYKSQKYIITSEGKISKQ